MAYAIPVSNPLWIYDFRVTLKTKYAKTTVILKINYYHVTMKPVLALLDSTVRIAYMYLYKNGNLFEHICEFLTFDELISLLLD